MMKAQPNLSGRVGPNGLVRIWLHDQKRWAERRPVDAREIIAAGSASLDAPGQPTLEPKAPTADEMSLEQLRARATELGEEVDGRWKADRLRKVIAAAEAKAAEGTSNDEDVNQGPPSDAVDPDSKD